MDPTATVQAMIDAVNEHRMIDAREDLIDWRWSGGFVNVRAENGEHS